MTYAPDSGEFYFIAAGVPKDRITECLEWAFGKSWKKIGVNEMKDIWNKKHSDLFVIDGADPVWKALVSIGMAWVDYVKPIDDKKKGFIEGGY